jgi:hypothetical protein
MTSYVRVDPSASSQLAYCVHCPPWRELRGERAAALTAAADHAQRVHGDDQRARELRQLAGRATRRSG